MNGKVDLVISQIQNELAREGVCDILKWSTFLATDVSTHLMFGESVGMLEKGEVRVTPSVQLCTSYMPC